MKCVCEVCTATQRRHDDVMRAQGAKEERAKIVAWLFSHNMELPDMCAEGVQAGEHACEECNERIARVGG